MNRREVIALIGGAAVAWPLGAQAQQPAKVPRIGIFAPATKATELFETGSSPAWPAFLRELRALGYVEGENVIIERRADENLRDRWAALAKELVALQPDVMVTGGTPAVRALTRETHTIPIVFFGVSDPVGTGLVKSLARPGENVTGFTNFKPSMAAKWVELIKEIAPGTRRVAVIFNKANPGAHGPMRVIAGDTALGLGLEVVDVDAPVQLGEELERAVEDFAQVSDGSIIVFPSLTTYALRDRIIALAARTRSSAIYPFRLFPDGGGLVSYGEDATAELRGAAHYVDRILHGASAAELPVQAPTKFELVINSRTAKVLGLTIPPSLLAIADEVIE